MTAESRRRAGLVVAAMLATFAGFRAVLHLRPNIDLVVAGYAVHHLYTGVLLMAIFGLPAIISGAHGRVSTVSAVGFAVGLTMALDQWVYLITTDGTNASYVTTWSLWTGAAMVIVAMAYAWFIGKRSERL